MSRNPAAPQPTGFVPVLRYRDVGVAVDWLERAFGFARHHTVEGDDGAIVYAQMRCGTGLIMLVPEGQSDLDRLMCQPAEAGGLETQVCYVVIQDAAAHCVRAAEAGARIVLALATDDRDGAGYSCRDLEGHVWSFGTYNPADAAAATDPAPASDTTDAPISAAAEASAQDTSTAPTPPRRTASNMAAIAAAVTLAVLAGGAGVFAAFQGALSSLAGAEAVELEEQRAVAEALPDTQPDTETGERLREALATAESAAEAARLAEQKVAAAEKARESAEAAAAAASATAAAERDKAEAMRLSFVTDAQKAEDALTEARTARANAELERSRLEHQLEAEKRAHAERVATVEALTDRVQALEGPSGAARLGAPAASDATRQTSTANTEPAAPTEANSETSRASPAAAETTEATASETQDQPDVTGSIDENPADAEADRAGSDSVSDQTEAQKSRSAGRRSAQKSTPKRKPQKTVARAAAPSKPPQVLEPSTKQWPYDSW